MIKELVVSIVCLLVTTTGFSFCILAEQDKPIIISEPGLSNSETAIYDISPVNDDNSIPSITFLDTLDQQQTNDSDYALTVTGNARMAQSFIPTLETLTRVELKLYKKGTLDTLIISIKSNLTGPDLTWIYLPGISLLPDKTWVECDFPDISVTPGDTYYITWDTLGGHDQYNNSYWCFGINNPYINGFAQTRLNEVWKIWNPVEFPYPDFCFKTYGEANNPPNKPNIPVGKTNGKINVEYTYTSSSTDPEGNQVYYLWDWGDGNNSGWLGPYNSGVTTDATYKWTIKDSYAIKVKTKDTFGAESPWSDPLPIKMPHSYIPMLQFLDVKACCFGGITSPTPGYLYLFGNQLFPLKSGKTVILFGGILVAANFTTEGAPMKTVQFYLDDVLMNEDTTAPYSVTLRTKHKGPATIKVTAVDILGRSTSDTLNIDNYLNLV